MLLFSISLLLIDQVTEEINLCESLSFYLPLLISSFAVTASATTEYASAVVPGVWDGILKASKQRACLPRNQQPATTSSCSQRVASSSALCPHLHQHMHIMHWLHAMNEKYVNFLMDASQAGDNSSTCRLQKYRCLQRQVESGPLAHALQQLPPSAEFCCRSRKSPLELDTIRPNPSTHPSATQTILKFNEHQTLDMLCVSCFGCLEQICL